jgi:hypothetical protein
VVCLNGARQVFDLLGCAPELARPLAANPAVRPYINEMVRPPFRSLGAPTASYLAPSKHLDYYRMGGWTAG